MQQPKSKAITPPDWVLGLRDELAAKTHRPKDKGWVTTREFAEMTGVSVNSAQIQLRRGVRIGVIERFIGTERFASGVKKQTWYRKKDKT